MATTVHCYLEDCIKRDPKEGICLAEDISLGEEHWCNGGCDEGWEFPEEEEEE